MEFLRGKGDLEKQTLSGIMIEEAAFLQTYTLQVIDTLKNFFFRYVSGGYLESM